MLYYRMDTHNEIWLTSPLAPDHVEVSNLGRARTLDRLAPVLNGKDQGKTQLRKGKILSPWIAKNGYFHISIQIGDTRKKYLLHRLVASAFCSDFDPKITVNHKDGNKLNNIPSNLEWVTLNENTSHQWRIGLVNLRGENHPISKLTEEKVLSIREKLSSNISYSTLAKEFSVSIAAIYKIANRKSWNHI